MVPGKGYSYTPFLPGHQNTACLFFQEFHFPSKSEACFTEALKVLMRVTTSLPNQILFRVFPAPRVLCSNLRGYWALSHRAVLAVPRSWLLPLLKVWPPFVSCYPSCLHCFTYFMLILSKNPSSCYFWTWYFTLQLILPSRVILNSSWNLVRYKDILTFKIDFLFFINFLSIIFIVYSQLHSIWKVRGPGFASVP